MPLRVDHDENGNAEVSAQKPRKLRPLDTSEDSSSPKSASSPLKRTASEVDRVITQSPPGCSAANVGGGGGGAASSSSSKAAPPASPMPPKSALKSSLKKKPTTAESEPPQEPAKPALKPALKSALKSKPPQQAPVEPVAPALPAPSSGSSPKKSALKTKSTYPACPPPEVETVEKVEKLPEEPITPRSVKKRQKEKQKEKEQEKEAIDADDADKQMAQRPSLFKMTVDTYGTSSWSARGLCVHYYTMASHRLAWEKHLSEMCKSRRSIKLGVFAGLSGLQAATNVGNTKKTFGLSRSKTDEIIVTNVAEAEEYQVSPLKEPLLEKKPSPQKVRDILAAMPDVTRWIDASLDSTPPAMPTPLFHAVAAVLPDIVELLVEFGCNVKSEYQGKSMLKGWIKPNTPLVECVRGRKARFMGTMLGDKLELIEEMLTRAATGEGGLGSSELAMEPEAEPAAPTSPSTPVRCRKSVQIECSSGLMLHTQGHANIKYEMQSEFNPLRFSSVKRAVYNGSGFSIKAARKVNEVSEKDPEMAIWAEIMIMRKICHPHIVKLFETFEDETHIFMVFELCTGGELFDAIAQTGQLDEGTAVNLAFQMGSAIRQLHSLKICHRDIQPQAFVLFRDDVPLAKSVLKLKDFNNAKEWEDATMKTKVCILHYAAPEVLNVTEDGYCAKVDIWSLGVLLFTMLTGAPPFEADTCEETIELISKGVFAFKPLHTWRGKSDEVKNLLTRMLAVDPASRLDGNTLLDHEWIRRGENAGNFSTVGMPVPVKLLPEAVKWEHCPKKVVRKLTIQMAEKFSDRQVQELGTIFRELDTNNTGMVDFAACHSRLVRLVSSSSHTKDLLKILELETLKGIFNYKMILGAMRDARRTSKRQAAQAVFNVFDIDRNGSISLYEIAQALSNEDEVQNLHRCEVSFDAVQEIWGEMEEVFSDMELEDREMTFNEFFNKLPRASADIWV